MPAAIVRGKGDAIRNACTMSGVVLSCVTWVGANLLGQRTRVWLSGTYSHPWRLMSRRTKVPMNPYQSSVISSLLGVCWTPAENWGARCHRKGQRGCHQKCVHDVRRCPLVRHMGGRKSPWAENTRLAQTEVLLTSDFGRRFSSDRRVFSRFLDPWSCRHNGGHITPYGRRAQTIAPCELTAQRNAVANTVVPGGPDDMHGVEILLSARPNSQGTDRPRLETDSIGKRPTQCAGCRSLSGRGHSRCSGRASPG